MVLVRRLASTLTLIGIRPKKPYSRQRLCWPCSATNSERCWKTNSCEIEFADQHFVVHYCDSFFPTPTDRWSQFLKRALDLVGERLEPEAAERMELESIVTALEHMPDRTQTDTDAVQQRYREKEVARRRLSALFETSGEIRQGLARCWRTTTAGEASRRFR